MREPIRWAPENEQYFARQSSAARVLLLGLPPVSERTYGEDAFRGLYRLLSEEHIPFAVSDNMDWLGKRNFDLVLAADWAPPELERFAQEGGRVLIASANRPGFDVAPVLKSENDLKGYVRVRNHAAFPSLSLTDLLMLNGSFTYLKSEGSAPLTLVPPSMIGPPEFVHIDMSDTDTPAIATKAVGKGRVVWLPWNLAELYYRHSLPAHADLFRDVVNSLLQHPQVSTGAHRLVEMTLMEQAGRTLLHLVNLSGHSQTGYFPPVPMRDLRISVQGSFRSARTVRNAGALRLVRKGEYVEFTVPQLMDYEMIVLQR
jgi:hypothetical protein